MGRFLTATIFWAGALQAAEIALPTITAKPGDHLVAGVNFTAQDSQVTGLQFDLECDPGLTIAGSAGTAASSAGKSLATANRASGKKRFLVIGPNQTSLTDGVVVSLNIDLPAKSAARVYVLHISNARATDKEGNPVSLSAVDGRVSIAGVTSPLTAGAMPQIVSGGNWKTTITLLNTGSARSPLQLNFWGDDGSARILPFTFPQVAGPDPTSAFSLGWTLNPGQLFVLETEAPVPLVAWAELAAASDIAGFAVLRQRGPDGRDSEVAVPLDSSGRPDYLVPYDNTAGFVTGVAITNLSAESSVNIMAILTDDAGNAISVESIPLPARGHLSFRLIDRYPKLNGLRGVVEFQNPTGSPIAVLGLRFNPLGSFTSIPVIPR